MAATLVAPMMAATVDDYTHPGEGIPSRVSRLDGASVVNARNMLVGDPARANSCFDAQVRLRRPSDLVQTAAVELLP